MQQYAALAGDLVGSRGIVDRKAAAESIAAGLAAINDTGRGVWLAPLVATRGIDEISGVLHSAAGAFDVAVALNEAIWPLRFRFALGLGAIDIGLDGGDAGAMDGPAFHRAAEGMRRARRERLPFVLEGAGLGGSGRDLAEAAGALHAIIVGEWSAGVQPFVSLYRVRQKQADVARETGVTQQAVSGALRRARFRDLRRCERAIGAWLATLDGAAEPEGPTGKEP